jgi:uncharacterized Zn finger protein
MGFGYYAWGPYVSAAERRAKAVRHVAQLRKRGQTVTPVVLEGRVIARTFWGKAWCQNLESYSDYANRLPRGRTYVRNGSVIHLHIEAGAIHALVSGSDIYETSAEIAPVAPRRWKSMADDCAGQIDSVVELLAGKLAKGVMARLCTKERGLFPTSGEIDFSCSCPDSASMCKHVAALLYAVGARLDEKPELLFLLRQVDEKELVAKAGASLIGAKPAAGRARVLDGRNLGDVFGIDIQTGDDPALLSPPPAKGRRSAPRPKAIITARELLARGIPRTTFQNWVTSGHLRRTDKRGVYRVSRAAGVRIGRFSAR